MNRLDGRQPSTGPQEATGAMFGPPGSSWRSRGSPHQGLASGLPVFLFLLGVPIPGNHTFHQSWRTNHAHDHQRRLVEEVGPPITGRLAQRATSTSRSIRACFSTIRRRFIATFATLTSLAPGGQ